jgi:cell division septation protein DedD
VASAKKPDVKPLVVDGPDRSTDQAPAAAASEPETKAEEPAPEKPVEAPKPAPAPEKKPAPAPAKPEPVKAAAPAPKAPPKSATGTPVTGQRYLQLAAIDKDHADSLVDLLRQKGFKALDTAVPENPKVYRVLVGPVKDGEMSKLRSDLQSKSFPGNAGVARLY